MSVPDPPQLEPVRNDGIRAVQVGLGLFAVAGLVLLVQRDALADRDSLWWLAVCGAGLLIGLVQWAIFSRRRVLIRARERAARDASRTDAGGSGPAGLGPTSAGPIG
jgi:ABC-type nickel/cobalt efflux system permease component RcnA